MKATEILSHYTQFPVLLNILEYKKIVLGNPENWDDKTDKNIVEYEKNKYEKKTIRALCLTEFTELGYDNILHWKIYAAGKSGCRIDFDKEMLEEVVKSHKAEIGKVKYLNSEALKKKPKNLPKNPLFLKRNSYSAENEWRIVWIDKENKKFELNISKYFKKGIIKCIRLSPDLPEDLAKKLCSFLKKKYKIKFVHSWILQNPNWEREARKIFNLSSTEVRHEKNNP
ncbi:MAG: DUF2971 domain-containing protein [Fibromonadaceae bacterium]|jgi:hypothetical protein|nr:DUF2971 domain-containing protein [Fibromonadaceae bacterium]